MEIDRLDPVNQAEPTPKEYEQQVVSWLRGTGAEFLTFTVEHQRTLPGDAGEYEIDAVVELQWLGARFIVLVECKRHVSPVKREVLLALDAKIRDTNAHKGMVFSTSGFQRGARTYAEHRNIFTAIFRRGEVVIETRAQYQTPQVVPGKFRFAGVAITPTETGVQRWEFDDDNLDAVEDWLGASDG